MYAHSTRMARTRCLTCVSTCSLCGGARGFVWAAVFGFFLEGVEVGERRGERNYIQFLP